jgi:HD-like signal output (HDOD) protein
MGGSFMKKRILFVDDEIKILKSFEMLFMYTDYEIVVADSGMEALNIIENQEIDMVISDMRMPNMTGYELLVEVKKRFPHIVRIILSEAAEDRIIFDSLQKNIAKLYFLKPWENINIITAIDNVFKMENVLKNNSNVLKLIKNADELPTIKASYQRITDEIERDAEIYKIVEAIESDNSIATKLLHIINSSHYGVKTGSIKRAVAYLGLDNVKNIVIASAFVDSLGFDSKDKEILRVIWKQAFISNRIVSYIYSEFLNKRIPEIEMNAGLLSNIGMAFMMQNFNDRYKETLQEVRAQGINIIEFENKCFGTNHQEIGGYLLRWWDIPLPIVEASLYHHDPFNENIINKQIVFVTHVAEKYAWKALGENNFMQLYENVFCELGINKEHFEERLMEFLRLHGLIDG